MSDTNLLSAANPLATIDQRETEDRAMRLVKRPAFERARKLTAHLWRNCADYPARDQMANFDSMIDEYVFYHAMWAANADPARPRVSWVQIPAHNWFGRDVPGCRWGGESPDAIYRMIPIEYGGQYELHVQPTCEDVPMSVYSLMGDNSAQPVTQGLLDSPDMVPNNRGELIVTLDPSPADGRPNHIQTRPGADHLNTRDIIADWSNQSSNALTIKRLDNADRAPLSDEEVVAGLAARAIDGVYFAYYCSMSGSNLAPNELRVPVSSAITAGLSNQLGTKGNFTVGDDEALIITANRAGARFRSAVLYDVFSLSLQYWSHTSSLNMTQMEADEDGMFTFIVAHEDPGVHNWLDTCGRNRTIFGHRWQSFQAGSAREDPFISTRLVKFRDLDAALPAGVKRIDAAGRKSQLAAREAGFRRRLLDR